MIEAARTGSLGGKVVGWMQGRMEFGPRALGGRSILGDAAFVDDAEADQSEDQIPGESSDPLRHRCCAKTSASGSSSTATVPTCCW